MRMQGILERVPGARLAFVGDGPAREELHEHFAGTNTVFMGMLHGEELSAAYASADVFCMPSESETLGESGVGGWGWGGWLGSWSVGRSLCLCERGWGGWVGVAGFLVRR